MEQRSKRMDPVRMWNALRLSAALVGCAHQAWAQQHSHSAQPMVAQAPQTGAPPQPSASPAAAMAHGDMHAPTIFTLRSGIAHGRMVYLGVGLPRSETRSRRNSLGARIDAMAEEELADITERTTVFAKLTPSQKER